MSGRSRETDSDPSEDKGQDRACELPDPVLQPDLVGGLNVELGRHPSASAACARSPGPWAQTGPQRKPAEAAPKSATARRGCIARQASRAPFDTGASPQVVFVCFGLCCPTLLA